MSGMSNGLFVGGEATGISSLLLPFVVEVHPIDDANVDDADWYSYVSMYIITTQGQKII